MREKTIADMLGDIREAGSLSPKGGRPLSIWMPGDAKDRFDKLQAITGRQFGKRVREALLELISIAEARVS